LDDQAFKPAHTGRGGAVLVVLLAILSCGFWLYQGAVRRQRHEWLTAVKSLGLSASIMPASQWTSQMYVPGPQQIMERDVVIVMVDSEAEGQALLTAPAACPHDTKIYAFDGLSTQNYARLEERFPTAVVFTRITN
jgi:hypothetical protein